MQGESKKKFLNLIRPKKISIYLYKVASLKKKSEQNLSTEKLASTIKANVGKVEKNEEEKPSE